LTDNAGKFSINASGSDVLVFSYVGYNTQEVRVNNRQSVNASMAINTDNMENIVVTALGIRRQEKKLGYATTQVNTDELVKNRTTNLGESLEGRVAGLNITPPAAGAGGSTQIRLRGQVGFAGTNNSPLIVINGLPIDQDARGVNGAGNQIDAGDNLLNINPEDIESMTVLKGSTASALYGSRATAGVIIITTKSGNRNQGIGVEYSSSYTAQNPLNYYDQFQTMYGQGNAGKKPTSAGDAASTGQLGWGARLDGSPTPIFDGSTVPYSAYEDRLFDYLQTGTDFTNTIAFSGGGANGSFRASVSNTRAKGIEPHNRYNRRIVNLGVDQNITKNLKFNANINWANEERINPPRVGTQGQGSINFFNRLAINIPISAFENSAIDPVTGTENQTSGFQGTLLNPYYAHQAGQSWVNKRDRILGTASLRWDILKWLYLQGRFNYDYSVSFTESKDPAGIGTSNPKNADGTYKGSYNLNEGKGTDINADFLLGGSHEFGKFSVDASFGGNTWRMEDRSFNIGASNFVVKDFFALNNATVKNNPSYGYGIERINSLYGTAEFGYNNLVYLTFTGREDWFSKFNPDLDHLFYPSVSGSFIFSQLVKPNWLDYGKLRASWAQTGSPAGANRYEGLLTYGLSSTPFNGQIYGSINGGTSPNPFLQPFKLEEEEIGLELRMFHSRVNLDISAFRKITSDQVLNVTLSNTSGYTGSKDNLASLRNSGLETMLEVIPVRGKNFRWSSSWNNTYLATKVLEIAPGVDDFLLIYFNGTGNEFLGELHYTKGMAMNQLYTRTYLRDDKGNILVSSSGRLRATPDFRPVGSSIPKFTGGWNNSFSYKNLTLGVLIDYKFGGTVLSSTKLNTLRQGLSNASLVGRRDGEDGIIVGTTQGGVLPTGTVINQGTGQPNTAKVTDLSGFYADYRNLQIGDPFTFKSDFIKLRNVSLSYNLSSVLQKSSYTKFVKGLVISASVRNAAIIHKDIEGLDPEAIQSSGDVRAGYENSSLPTTRNYNLSLNVKF
jgi:TonB-linked SusC/RagA family outer membrane protein